jgi:hypothetical protein
MCGARKQRWQKELQLTYERVYGIMASGVVIDVSRKRGGIVMVQLTDLTEEVVTAVGNLVEAGWEAQHLLNVSEFIDVHFQNAGIHSPGEAAHVIAEYLAEHEKNVITYVGYVLSVK